LSDPPRFDLQSHSSYSDGALAPAGVVEHAAAAGVRLLALTDHDNVDGVGEAMAAASELGIGLVPAVEISARDLGARRDLHVLGYGIDHRDAELRRWLAHSRSARERRATAIEDRLRELGFELDETALRDRAAAGRSIGRPHLAQAAVAVPANRARLEREGIADASAFLEAYLIPGRPAFRPRETPTVEAAIARIHAVGGVSVWAHPFWDVTAPVEVTAMIERLHGCGLDGVECFYPSHTREQTELLYDCCQRLGLLSTGSADFHGPAHPNFSRFRAFETYGCEPVLGAIARGPS
jgi:3',5'-nucleoside bisphosphate phosphatase